MSPPPPSPPPATAAAAASFDSLPDELVLRIVRQAARGHFGRPHTFLVQTVSRVSARFRRIAADPTLWKGEVELFVPPIGDGEGEQEMGDIVERFLNKQTERLSLVGPGESFMPRRKPLLSGADVVALAAQCPALRHLHVEHLRLESWPSLSPPGWTSLLELDLQWTHLSCNMFEGVELNNCLPKLQAFCMAFCDAHDGEWILLPDMTDCRELLRVELKSGQFRFPTDLAKRVPLPRALKSFICAGVIDIDGYPRHAWEDHIYDHMEDPYFRFNYGAVKFHPAGEYHQ